MKIAYLSIILLIFGAPVLTAQSQPAKVPAAAREALKPLEPGVIEIDGAPWSVGVSGDVIYFSIIGKDYNPTERLEDGYIGEIKAGEKEAAMVTKPEYLSNPAGLYVDGDEIVVGDMDQVYKIDKNTGKMTTYFSITTDGPYVGGITSVAKMDDRLVLTCMQDNRIYFVDETSATYAPLVTKEPINSPSCVIWDKETNLLYIAEAAVEVDKRGKVTPLGRLLAVNPVTGEVTVINPRMRELKGQFMGLALKDGELYFSDWCNDKKPEAIRKINLKSLSISNVATSSMQGAGAFVLRGNQIIIPVVKDKKIVIANLPPPKR